MTPGEETGILAPGCETDTYVPEWLRARDGDAAEPFPVPQRDADGCLWQVGIDGAGRVYHQGTYKGRAYRLEWLPKLVVPSPEEQAGHDREAGQ